MSSAARLRLAISLCGMAVALLIIFNTPFGGWADVVAAGAVLLASSTGAERIFRMMADASEQAADLRDRVDNPPS